MIRIYTWAATEEELDTLYRLINSTLGEKTTRETHDLSRNQTIETGPEDILIACGMRCFNIVSASVEREVHRLPTPKQLLHKNENKAHRESAFKYLQELNKNKDSIIIPQAESISAEELKNFTIPLLKKLKETLEEKNVEYWKGKTTSGKTIAITIQNNIDIKDCDILLTFEEIVAAKIATEVMNLDQLTFVLGEDK